MSSSRYRRVLLKLSGEALAGEGKTGIDPAIVSRMAGEIREVHEMGVSGAIVIGAGNFFRGAMGEELGIGRVTGDHMGMLATVMNSLAVQDALVKAGVPSCVMSAIAMDEVAEHYTIRGALDRLDRNETVIVAGGPAIPISPLIRPPVSGP
jgi:uridylate kinase